MPIEHVKPEYQVTIGSAYFCIIENRDNNVINYRNTVFEVPTIKTQGVTRVVSELEVYASGILFDYINRTAGANINLNAVTLPQFLLNDLEGATEQGGFTFNRTNDLEKEFAYGYWGENSDGSLVYYWHPVCKLIPTEENHQTRTADIPEPQRNYNIKIIPYNGLWRVKYSTSKAIEEGLTPKTIGDFFSTPIYQENQLGLSGFSAPILGQKGSVKEGSVKDEISTK